MANNTSPSGWDCYSGSPLTGDGGNLIENNDGCGTPAVSGDPGTLVLGSNGGSTQTMALLAGSPAIDAGTHLQLDR